MRYNRNRSAAESEEVLRARIDPNLIMKTLSSVRPRVLACLYGLAAAFGLATSSPAVTLTVSPTAISSTYTGLVVLQITDLNGGETVTVDRFLDSGNGTLGAGDYCTAHFQVTDNQASLIGGVTNTTAPYDANSASGAISVPLNYFLPDSEHIMGTTFFRVSTPWPVGRHG